MCGLLILISKLVYTRRSRNSDKFEMAEHIEMAEQLPKASLPCERVVQVQHNKIIYKHTDI